MSKSKLTAEQNKALQSLPLQEKLNLLFEWKQKIKISQEQFEYFSNRLIKRESKKMLSPIVKDEPKEKNLCRSIVQGEIEAFIGKLRGDIKKYIALRNRTDHSLNDDDLWKFKSYVINYPYYQILINDLLVVGLRYPDKELSLFCSDYIEKNKLNSKSLWLKIWQSPDLVPMDAVRIILKEADEAYGINPLIDLYIIKDLLPFFKIQRDKEEQRLYLAQLLETSKREAQVARKTKRLEAFNNLIRAAEKSIL